MDYDIKSKENAKVKYVKKLISSGNFRKKEKSFVLEGTRLCYDAFLSNVYIAETYYTENISEKGFEKIKKIIASSEKSYKVPKDILREMSDTQSPQGIVCVCKELDKQLSLDKINNVGKFIILENIQDPSNLGTIIRTAEAIGINNLIMSKDCCDIYNSKVLRGSMGAVFRVKIYFSSDISKTIGFLKSKGIKIYAAVPDRLEKSITDIDYNKSVAIAIGNEGNGLRKNTIDACNGKVTIPMLGRAESINAAMAASIIMWEMMRGSQV